MTLVNTYNMIVQIFGHHLKSNVKKTKMNSRRGRDFRFHQESHHYFGDS